MLVIVIAIAACAAPRSAASPTPPRPTATATRTPAPTARPTPLPTIPAPSATLVARRSGEIHYVAIGASDTVGVGSVDPANGSWPSRIAALLPAGSTYANLGVSGSLTAQAQRDQLPAAIGQSPTVVSIWLAVNDMTSSVPAADHAAALGAIVDALVAGTPARIFVGNVPDLRAVPAFAANDQAALLAQIQAYNAGIASLTARHPGRAVLVDLFAGSAALTSQLTVSADGFHPSDAGYLLIAERFAEAMRANGIPLKPGP